MYKRLKNSSKRFHRFCIGFLILFLCLSYLSVESLWGDFEVHFQNPSYLTERIVGKSHYTCDTRKKECKVNMNILWKDGKKLSRKYVCTIQWWTMLIERCNPKTIIFPVWEHSIEFRVYIKKEKKLVSQWKIFLSHPENIWGKNWGKSWGKEDMWKSVWEEPWERIWKETWKKGLWKNVWEASPWEKILWEGKGEKEQIEKIEEEDVSWHADSFSMKEGDEAVKISGVIKKDDWGGEAQSSVGSWEKGEKVLWKDQGKLMWSIEKKEAKELWEIPREASNTLFADILTGLFVLCLSVLLLRRYEIL